MSAATNQGTPLVVATSTCCEAHIVTSCQCTSLALCSALCGLRLPPGVCPQFDLLWPDLTVMEHLQLYARIKGVRPQPPQVHPGLSACQRPADPSRA